MENNDYGESFKSSISEMILLVCLDF